MLLTQGGLRGLRSSHRIIVDTGGRVRSYAVSGARDIPESKQKYVPTSGTYPLGFKAGCAHVGVKASNTQYNDLALIASNTPCTGSAVFTRNRFQAAPIRLSKEVLYTSKGNGLRSIVVNSGCANAVTGNKGFENAREMASATDRCFIDDKNEEADKGGSRTIVMSTGVIGQQLPIEKIVSKIPTAYHSMGDGHEDWLAAAQAICTTDTFPKLVSKTFTLPSSQEEYHMVGMVKGAGMIHPNMATLLGIICTDAPVAHRQLYGALRDAVKQSFNCITIDGDTSTNDTIAILANGEAGGKRVDSKHPEAFKAFQATLTEVATDLAKLIVRDGEGATRFITVRVEGRLTQKTFRSIARSIATSSLVKTAIYGKDANWGRILSAIGSSKVQEHFELHEVNVSFVPADSSEELKVVINGEPEQVDEIRAAEILAMEDVEIKVKIGEGDNKALFWTCDLSHEYITINADYRT